MRRTARQPQTAPAVLRIERLGERGDGIGRLDTRPVYVAGALPGELVRIGPGRKRGDGVAADLVELLEPAPERQAPPCRHFAACGGCALQHLAPSAYRAWKEERLATALARAGLRPAAIEPLVAIDPASRRRVELVARRQGGRVRLGFHERASHRVVDLADCRIMVPPLLALLPPLRAALAEVLPEGGEADLLATATETGIDLLVQAGFAPGLAARQALADLAGQAGIARITWREPGEPEEPILLQRRPAVSFAGVLVDLPPGGFLQASAAAEAALVGAALAALPRHGRIADLYAGCGTFSFAIAMAGAAERVAVHAVEGDAAALGALLAAARRAGLADRVTGERRDLAGDPPLPAELGRYDAVLFDPPRAGGPAVAGALAASAVRRVVAVSCNPASFARDARTLVDGGFALGRVTPVDQFVWSPHLELVAELSR
jgi:23S rRNA (uracil1939-C5)-methyltransferase